jgi:hypothetical protein
MLHLGAARRTDNHGEGDGGVAFVAGPKVWAAIAQVAVRYQIPAELTGVTPPQILGAFGVSTAMICGDVTR